ncbi:MAG: hypothetical protein ACJ77B_07510 [Chloroflexota bacterium]
MPFDFLRRKKGDTAAAGGRTDAKKRAAGTVIRFDGLTEEWRLVGRMHLDTRLSDALNRREAVPISDVSWAPIDGSSGFTEVPGLKSVDPYDLIVVLAGEGSQGPLTEAEQEAYKVHRVAYDVALEAPPFRIVGTVYLLPGTEPERLLDRATEMFLPVVGGVVSVGDRTVSDPDVDAVLVNRFYLRGVLQVDKRTGEPAQKLPGAPLGGVSWQDRTR